MIHAISYFIFSFALAAWLRFELKRPASLLAYRDWVIGAFAFGTLGTFLSGIYGGLVGNFLLHGIGGGMAAACMFFYLVRTFDITLNWRLELASLFLFASALGVLNELAEYLIELLFNVQLSFDSHDTWRDLVANTSGALVVWILVKIISTSKKSV